MLKKTQLQMIATLAIGGALGYAAASGRLDCSRRGGRRTAAAVRGRQRGHVLLGRH